MAKTNTKQNTTLMLLLAVAVIVILGTLMLSNKKITSPTVTGTPAAQAIRNTSDLDQASDELDSVNLNEFDTSLNEINTDASGF